MDHNATHDPGGKVRLRPKDGTYCDARISPCMRYRPVLLRKWNDGPGILWIGMNPSTADAMVDDPTIAKECRMSRRWRYDVYLKCNVSDYRATNPRDLEAYVNNGGAVWSPDNLAVIKMAAEAAGLTILACGVMRPFLAPYARQLLACLRMSGHRVHVLGLTKDGWPRHSLYLREDTQPVLFEGDLPAG